MIEREKEERKKERKKERRKERRKERKNENKKRGKLNIIGPLHQNILFPYNDSLSDYVKLLDHLFDFLMG